MSRKNAYAKRLNERRADRTIFLTQMCKDAALIAANEAWAWARADALFSPKPLTGCSMR